MLGSLDPICRDEIEFAPSVIESRKPKNSNRGGNDQSGSHSAIRSVPHRITGSALPSSMMRMSTIGRDSRVPQIMDLALGEEIDPGASAASNAVACQTRNGASNGTAASNFAESALQDSEPTAMTARPSSIASLITTKNRIGSLSVTASPKLSSVAQVNSTTSGASSFF